MSLYTGIPPLRNTVETYSARPERELTVNDDGKMICTHDECRVQAKTFQRLSDWNKHMDRHERPYKCNEPTCEQNPGFTYNGGLLGHMREVHKKGVGPARRPLFCPHADCIRSTGEVFTRRENLEEHLRRKHSYIGHYSPPPDSTSSQNKENPDQPRKRRKTVDIDSAICNQLNQHTQLPDRQLPDSQQDLAPTDLQSSDLNGDSVLNEVEANRQLSIARQTIVKQQEVIRRQDEELHTLRSTLHNSKPPQPSSLGTSNRSSSLIAMLDPARVKHLEQSHAEFQSQILQVDIHTVTADHNAGCEAATDPALRLCPAPNPRTKTEKDVPLNGNGSEPSRRIEIVRDLVSAKVAAMTS